MSIAAGGIAEGPTTGGGDTGMTGGGVTGTGGIWTPTYTRPRVEFGSADSGMIEGDSGSYFLQIGAVVFIQAGYEYTRDDTDSSTDNMGIFTFDMNFPSQFTVKGLTGENFVYQRDSGAGALGGGLVWPVDPTLEIHSQARVYVGVNYTAANGIIFMGTIRIVLRI